MPNFVSLAQTMWKMDFSARHFGSMMASFGTSCIIFVTY